MMKFVFRVLFPACVVFASLFLSILFSSFPFSSALILPNVLRFTFFFRQAPVYASSVTSVFRHSYSSPTPNVQSSICPLCILAHPSGRALFFVIVQRSTSARI